MSKPPKIVIPGLNRGIGIPAGYAVGRIKGKGPAQLLNLIGQRRLGMATAFGVVMSNSQTVSVAHSETLSLSTSVSTSLSSVTSTNVTQSTSLSQISNSLSTTNSTNVTQSTSLSQVSSSLSGAISSTSSLSTAVSTVISGSISTVTSMVNSLSAASGGGGATTFLALTDTPATYVGQTGKVPSVNGAETALEFVALPGGTGQSTSLSQISSSLSGAISSTTSLSSAVSTVDSNQSTSISANLSKINSLSTAIGSGSGALVLLEQHTASSSASLDFTTAISATYDEYLIEFVNIIPATNAVSLYMRMSTNAGVSYDSGTNYSYNASGLNRFGIGQTGVDSGGTQILLTKSAIDNTSTAGVSGSLRLFSPSSTALHKNITGQLNILTGGVLETQQSSGWYRSTTAVDAFQFLMSSGNISSGTIRVYGIAK